MVLSKEKTIIMVLLVSLFSNYPNSTNAGEFIVIPFISLTEEYNDNIFMADEDETATEDFITSILPGLRFERKTERLNAWLSGQVDFLVYNDNKDLNTEDQNFTGNIDFRLTPRLYFIAAAGYTKDSRRDRDIERTGLVILSNTERSRQEYKFSVDYDISEKTSTELSYTYNQDDYDDEKFIDFQSHEVGLSIDNNMSNYIPNLNGRVNLEYTRYDFRDSLVNDYSLTLGVSYEISEVFSFLVDIGARYSQSEFESILDNSEEWGPIGEVSIKYNGERTKSNLTIYKDLKVVSGREGTSDRAALVFDVYRNLTENIRCGLITGYYMNNADQDELSSEEIDEHTFRIQPRIQYNLTKDISLMAAYTYTLIDDKDDDLNRQRNIVFIRLKIKHPLFE